MQPEVAVVVGVGSGLGWSLAKRFADAGMHVLAAARTADKLDGWIREHGTAGKIEPFACDATAPDQVAALFAAASGAGRLRAAIFNAGAFEMASILDVTPESFERCWKVGCLGGLLVGQAAARQMLPDGEGSILFTGATASLRGSARFVNLAVPKFGLRALAQSMARELGPKGLHVAHVIVDGQVESERYRTLGEQRGPDSLLAPDAIAESYYQLHRQPRSAWTLELDLRPWVEKF